MTIFKKKATDIQETKKLPMTGKVIVFCDRYGKDLRKFYRCEETGTRFKTLCPFCIGERCYHIRNGDYACII